MNIKTPYQDLVHEVAEKETENESLRARVAELSKSERTLLKAVDDNYRSREKITLAFDASMMLLDKLRGQVEDLVSVYEDLKDLPQDERFSIGIKRLTAQRDQLTQLRREIEAMGEKYEVERMLRKQTGEIDRPKETLELLVRCAFELGEISHGRACEILQEDMVTFRERCWVQDRLLDQLSEIEAMRDDAEVGRLVSSLVSEPGSQLRINHERIGIFLVDTGPLSFFVAEQTFLEALRKAANNE